METYRAYALNASGSIVRQAYFDARDDDEATEWVRGWDPVLECELWQGHRKITVLRARALIPQAAAPPRMTSTVGLPPR